MPRDRHDSPGSPVRVRPAAPAEHGELGGFIDSTRSRSAGTAARERSAPGSLGIDARGRPIVLLRADQDGRLRGVAGVAPNGDVATWAIDESDGGESVACVLLQACAKEAAALGAPELRIYMPPASVPGERALFEMGFRPIAPSFITLRVVHFPSLLEALARGSIDRVARFAPFRLHVHLTPGRYPELAHQDMEIRIDPAAASVLPGHAATADARVEMSATTLTELLFGADGGAALRDPVLVRVTPPERTATVHAIMEALAVQGGWYTPIGDRR